MDFKYIVLILCLLLLAFLLYKEISRANKGRLVWRVLASLIAVICFALLIIPVKYETSLRRNANEITLLTAGINPDSIAKLKGQKYSLASADLVNAKTILIPDLSYFLATHKDIKKLNIYGNGLSDEELKSVNGYEINFHPAAKPNGVISANWQHKIKTTEQLNVQGIYQNTSNEKVKILLKGLGNSIDSLSIEPKSDKSFSFNTQPKQTGKAIYQLIALQGRDTLSKEPIPFLAGEQSPMKVLILASFPDFEYKFLKKWLFENKYPLAFRSQISKNKYSTDFLNMDSLSLNRINASSLKKFDVLIIDEEELAALGGSERAAIDNAVNSGMGIVIRILNAKSITPISGRFGRFESPVPKDKQLGLLLKDENYKFSKLPLEQTLFLKASQNDQPLVADGSGKILVNSTIKGSGKILISSLVSTFNWLLSGKTSDYTTYWSEILSKAARKKPEIQSVKTTPQFPVINEKIRFVVDLGESGKIPKLKIDSLKLAPRQNIELPFQWDTTFWPTRDGWNNLSVNQSTQSFFIYKNTDWQALRNQQKINFTQLFIDKLKNQQRKTTITDISFQEDVSPWWFFAGFLLASAFLWYESRILTI
ncbi:hypothetical protein [Pedobacter mendelii]|uniref:Aerotolerance regulator N-terminal domain-containing protein n=1 Tax=Pedobacter mendelii TaxID=1908240 RepID=A0ABQ2BFV9_9SPHI|nr:hypothetical protein [Pedobacter mendelii]GGI24633.1 hypothetical protein GCM10008119_13630 [Pedobacter mendelii]